MSDLKIKTFSGVRFDLDNKCINITDEQISHQKLTKDTFMKILNKAYYKQEGFSYNLDEDTLEIKYNIPYLHVITFYLNLDFWYDDIIMPKSVQNLEISVRN